MENCSDCLALKAEVLEQARLLGISGSKEAALKAELERLKGKTGCCMQCEQYAKELERVKEVNKKWVEQYHFESSKYDALLSHAEKMAEALKKSLGWMRPIMDGFGVGDKQKDGTPSVRIVTLNPAEEALAAYKEFKNEK